MKVSQNVKAGILMFIVPFLLIVLFPFSEILENKSIDLRLRLRSTRETDRRIVVVSIDEHSFREMNLRWPWPRTVFASVLDKIAADSPLAIGIDVEFSEAGFTAENDARLASVMKKWGNVVIPQKLWSSPRGERNVIEIERAEDIFLSAAAANGYVNLLVDKDGYVRRLVPETVLNGEVLIPFAFAVAKTAQPQLKLPKESPFLINFTGGRKTFLSISISKILGGEIGAGFFKDKIVLIGAEYRESGDYILTPFSGSNGMSGVKVHGHIINSLLTNQLITDTPAFIDFLIFTLLLASFALLSVKLNPGLFWIISGGFAVLWFAASVLLFSRSLVLIPMADILLMLALVIAGSILFYYQKERNKRKEIRGIFSRFVSPEVVRQLVDSPELIKLGGEIRTVTLLFSDIRGFTTMSEQMSPNEVVDMLNDYFTAMTDVLFANQGTLNKYIGDAIFAFFGAPTGFEDTAERAVKTSLEMRKALAELNKKRVLEGKLPIKIGIGLHKGEVLVGNIGSSRQMEYTVIGDTVNVCSRIESYTKEANTDILISESVYKSVKQYITVETMPPVVLKGKQEAVTVHKLIEGTL